MSGYLTGAALSYALLAQGVESIHATVVVVQGGAVAFVADSGGGKSTLASIFLGSGYRLLTDDLLILRPEGSRLLALPGPSRIKVFPQVARTILRERRAGTPWNHMTRKRVYPLSSERFHNASVPLRAIYILGCGRARRVSIRRLSLKQAFLALMQATFNTRVVGPQRLQQHFRFLSDVAGRVPVKRLSYPQSLRQLPAVRDAILDDLAREKDHG